MPERRRLLERSLKRLNDLAPAGYSVGAHIRFAKPLFFRSTYPDAWRDAYRSGGLAMRDPLVFWGVGHTGAIRWSEVDLPDPFDIMGKAAAHGLRYGAVAATGKITSRTILGAARADRDLTDAELEQIRDIAEVVHEIAGDRPVLSDIERATLRALDGGMAPAAVAETHRISEGALDAQLSAAREKLGAGTTAEALRMARDYRLI